SQEGRTTNLALIIAYPSAKFLFNYFLKKGILDGIPGLISAITMSFHSFLVRGKLWSLQNKN
ncbi:MAG: glycosyltransferase family 2 protein, partial [Candidatus Levybacteria bacterium CG_4_10_14_0_2_um_filter_35_8]